MFNYFLYSLKNERAESSQLGILSRAWCWGGMGPTGTLVLSLPKSMCMWRGKPVGLELTGATVPSSHHQRLGKKEPWPVL